MTDQHFLTAAEAGQILPGKPSACAVGRWMRHGLRGVRLKYVPGANGAFYTTAAWCAEFTAALESADSRPAPRVHRERPTTNTNRDRYKAAMLELADR